MKRYILDSYNRFKRYSETLDVRTQLCNKTWIVFNDGGEREIYKFKEDGTIRIILSGRVTSGTWEYDPGDKSMIISASDQSIMVHPGIYEGILMGFQVDGTDECAFLIEENNAQSFSPKTMTELIEYFQAKEKKAIEEANERALIEQQNKEREELEKKRKAEEDARKAAEAEREKKEYEIKKSYLLKFLRVLKKNQYKYKSHTHWAIATLLLGFGLTAICIIFWCVTAPVVPNLWKDLPKGISMICALLWMFGPIFLFSFIAQIYFPNIDSPKPHSEKENFAELYKNFISSLPEDLKNDVSFRNKIRRLGTIYNYKDPNNVQYLQVLD